MPASLTLDRRQSLLPCPSSDTDEEEEILAEAADDEQSGDSRRRTRGSRLTR